jgi:hypothetical protein
MRRSFGQTSEGESVHFWSREKDEEAIALGTFLEQRFAIGPEAGGWRKGADVCKWARTHTHIQRSKQHRQTKQTHIQQFKNNLAFLFFASNPAV